MTPEQRSRLRMLGLLWGAAALVAFAVLAITAGVPQGPEGTLIAGALQTRVQVALLALAAAGLAVAVRLPALGGVVVIVAATGIGVLAAFEYRPLAAFVPFAALLVPGALLVAAGLAQRGTRWLAGAGIALVALLVVAGLGARHVHDVAFGPTHPGSATVLPDGTVRWIWSGAPAPRSAEVVAALDDEDARARLVVATDVRLERSVRRLDPLVRTEEGVVRFRVDGLRPGARYHYGLEVEGVLDRTRVGVLRTVPEGPTHLRIAFGACARRGSNGSVFDAIRATEPDLYLIAGDMYYADIEEDDEDRFRAELDLALTRPAQQALYLDVPVAYTWDDHDFGPDDADRTSPARGAAQAVYREYVPHAPLPGGTDDGPVNQAFTMGRLRFVLLDLRSERDPAVTPDGPGKSMLGARQRAWLQAELAAARRARQLVVMVSSVPWIGPAAAGADDWSGYAHERASVSRAIADAGAPVVLIAGDAHMVAIDDGTNSDYSGTGRAGIPVVHGAPLDRPGSAKGGPFSEGAYPGSGRFGTMSVVDDGGRMRVTLAGRDWRGRTIVSHSFTVTP